MSADVSDNTCPITDLLLWWSTSSHMCKHCQYFNDSCSKPQHGELSSINESSFITSSVDASWIQYSLANIYHFNSDDDFWFVTWPGSQTTKSVINYLRKRKTVMIDIAWLDVPGSDSDRLCYLMYHTVKPFDVDHKQYRRWH